MNIQDHILHTIEPSQGGVLLRSDLTALGSGSQVSAALLELCRKGLIERIERGVYVHPAKLAAVGRQALLQQAHGRQAQARQALAGRKQCDMEDVQKDMQNDGQQMTPTARHVSALARRLGISYTPTFSDHWACAVTRLADDEVHSDATDDLLVALTRAGKLSPLEMTRLVMEHHRTRKSHV